MKEETLSVVVKGRVAKEGCCRRRISNVKGLMVKEGTLSPLSLRVKGRVVKEETLSLEVKGREWWREPRCRFVSRVEG